MCSEGRMLPIAQQNRMFGLIQHKVVAASPMSISKAHENEWGGILQEMGMASSLDRLKIFSGLRKLKGLFVPCPCLCSVFACAAYLLVLCTCLRRILCLRRVLCLRCVLCLHCILDCAIFLFVPCSCLCCALACAAFLLALRSCLHCVLVCTTHLCLH